MSEIVNLNTFRKAKARTQKEQRAQNNRIKHGTPKVLKELANAHNDLHDNRLSGKMLSADKPASHQDKPHGETQPNQPAPEKPDAE